MSGGRPRGRGNWIVGMVERLRHAMIGELERPLDVSSVFYGAGTL